MLLLRHASAGARLSSRSRDRARKLDGAGRAAARQLPEALASHPIARIVTSPHARCVETVRPLARLTGIAIERRDELQPDAPKERILALLEELPDTTLVCTHREVFERLFDGEVTCEKGGTWVVERKRRRWRAAAYFAPPTRAKRARRRAALV